MESNTQSLENLIKDLQAELKQRDEKHQRQLKILEEKLESSSSQSHRRSATSRRKLHVPSLCRADFRKWYKSLKKDSEFPGFNIRESIESSSNKERIQKVIDAVEDDHNGRENCPWSLAQLKGAAMTHYKSQCQASKRKADGNKEKHKQLCRRQGRIRDKLQRRLKGLQLQSTWSAKMKQAIQDVMKADYMSSDESEMSEDDSGQYISAYRTKKLIWEKSVLTKVKKELDSTYHKSLPRRARSSFLRRYASPVQSRRPVPMDAPNWAARVAVNATLSSSVLSTSDSANSTTSFGDNIPLSPIY